MSTLVGSWLGAMPRGSQIRWFSAARRGTLDYRIRQRTSSPVAYPVRPASVAPEIIVAWGNMLATGISSCSPAVHSDMPFALDPGRPA